MTQSGFKVGQLVFVQTLKKEGLVLALRNKGMVEVSVGALTCVVPDHALRPISTTKKKFKTTNGRQHSQALASVSIAPLDLHGATAEEAESSVSSFISDALLSGVAEVEVIHGRGRGIVMKTVHDFLERCGQVKSFTLKIGNPGVTVVKF